MGQYSDLDDSRKESMEFSEDDDPDLPSGDDGLEEGIVEDDTDSGARLGWRTDRKDTDGQPQREWQGAGGGRGMGLCW